MASSDSLEEAYDTALLGILQKEGQILPFLDVVFGFLYRRTDFYHIIAKETDKKGFPPGIAEKLALKAFRKYEHLAASRNNNRRTEALNQEVEDAKKDQVSEKKGSTESQEKQSKDLLEADSYNGAITDKYRWSQSATDVDVYFKVPKHITKGKLVKVDFSTNTLKVTLPNEGFEDGVLVDGTLAHKINVVKSMWSLIPGDHIHINLEKQSEIWWDALLVGDAKIDVKKLECIKPIETLPEDEQATIEKLMFDENQKRLGKPTSEQMKLEAILKEAWDKEGSPFRGQAFDPSIINVSGGLDRLSGLGKP